MYYIALVVVIINTYMFYYYNMCLDSQQNFDFHLMRLNTNKED